MHECNTLQADGFLAGLKMVGNPYLQGKLVIAIGQLGIGGSGYSL